MIVRYACHDCKSVFDLVVFTTGHIFFCPKCGAQYELVSDITADATSSKILAAVKKISSGTLNPSETDEAAGNDSPRTNDDKPASDGDRTIEIPRRPPKPAGKRVTAPKKTHHKDMAPTGRAASSPTADTVGLSPKWEAVSRQSDEKAQRVIASLKRRVDEQANPYNPSPTRALKSVSGNRTLNRLKTRLMTRKTNLKTRLMFLVPPVLFIIGMIVYFIVNRDMIHDKPKMIFGMYLSARDWRVWLAAILFSFIMGVTLWFGYILGSIFIGMAKEKKSSGKESSSRASTTEK